MTKKVKIAIALGIIAVIGFSGYNYSQTKRASAEAMSKMVNTGKIRQGEIVKTISLKAPLEGIETAAVTSSLNYEVLQINVKEGDTVTKGQVLAVLDSSKIKRDISSANGTVELLKLQNQEKVSKEQTDYNNALIKLEDAHKEYDKAKVLVDAGIEPAKTLEDKQKTIDDCNTVIAKFNAVDGVIVSENSNLKSIQNAQNDVSRRSSELADCQIKSNIDGTVTRVNVNVGSLAYDTENKKPMFQIENIDQLKMKILVNEFDIGSVKLGQNVDLSANILGDKTVKGVVSRISPTGELKAGSNTERVVPVQVDVLEQNTGLIAGITAKAVVELERNDNALVIPMEALAQNEEGQFVIYRISPESTVEIIPVEIGIETELEMQVISDKLKADDVIILSPNMSLVEGAEVIDSNAAPDGGELKAGDGQ